MYPWRWVPVVSFGVVDDVLFVAYKGIGSTPAPPDTEETEAELRKWRIEAPLIVARSTDRGRTWMKGVEVDISRAPHHSGYKPSGTHGQSVFVKGDDDAISFNSTLFYREPELGVGTIYRSRDGGST